MLQPQYINCDSSIFWLWKCCKSLSCCLVLSGQTGVAPARHVDPNRRAERGAFRAPGTNVVLKALTSDFASAKGNGNLVL